MGAALTTFILSVLSTGHTVMPTKDYDTAPDRRKKFISAVAKQQHDASKVKTLAHLEEVLNSLNSNTASMLDVRYSSGIVKGGNSNGLSGDGKKEVTLAEEQVMMKRFARPTNQIKGLINMINDTAAELDL